MDVHDDSSGTSDQHSESNYTGLADADSVIDETLTSLTMSYTEFVGDIPASSDELDAEIPGPYRFVFSPAVENAIKCLCNNTATLEQLVLLIQDREAPVLVEVWDGDTMDVAIAAAVEAKPTDHDMARLLLVDTLAKGTYGYIAPKGVKYLKMHMEILVDHLKLTGYDTSKLNLDSPLGIPRVDPRFLPAQSQHSSAHQGGNHNKDHNTDGSDGVDHDNGGECPN